MTLALVRLTEANTHLLDALERTPGEPPAWVVEVEDFVFGAGLDSHIGVPTSFVLVAVDGDETIGVAVHEPHPKRHGIEYIDVVLVDHRRRGRGYGGELLRLTRDHALASNDRSYAAWVVHPDNTTMQHLSASLGERLAVDDDTGYILFVHP